MGEMLYGTNDGADRAGFESQPLLIMTLGKLHELSSVGCSLLSPKMAIQTHHRIFFKRINAC